MKSTDFLNMPTDFRAALERLISAYDEHGGKWPQHDEDALHDAVKRARADLAAEPLDPAGGGEALLAAPAAEGEDPTTEELNRLYREIYGLHSDVLGPMPRKFARAVLARWGRPAATLLQQQAAELAALRTGVVPVAVSERPWEREGWCDEQRRCWFLSLRFLTWSLESPPVALCRHIARLHSLPFHAIPLPAPQAGEVK